MPRTLAVSLCLLVTAAGWTSAGALQLQPAADPLPAPLPPALPVVPGLNADFLDGRDASAFLGRNEKAADSELLDGRDSTSFADAQHDHDERYLGIAAKAADADKLDGLDSSQFLRSDASGALTGNLTITGRLDVATTLSNPRPVHAPLDFTVNGRVGVGTAENVGAFGSARLVLHAPTGSDTRPLTLSRAGRSDAGDRLGLTFVHPDRDGSFPDQFASAMIDAKTLAYDGDKLTETSLEFRLLQNRGDVGLVRFHPNFEGAVTVGQAAAKPLDKEMLTLWTQSGGDPAYGTPRVLARLCSCITATGGAIPALGFTSFDTGWTAHDMALVTATKERTWTSDPATQDGALQFRTLKDGVMGTRVIITSAGDVGVGVDPTAKLDVNGLVRARSGFQTGDVAEPVAGEGLEAGDVVVLDGFTAEGKLRVRRADAAYDVRVVGVVSTNPSLLLAGLATDAPLAVAGIAPVKVVGPVQEGDLLASSAVPGRAMRCEPSACGGAILGKALEAHGPGLGLVRTLVAMG